MQMCILPECQSLLDIWKSYFRSNIYSVCSKRSIYLLKTCLSPQQLRGSISYLLSKRNPRWARNSRWQEPPRWGVQQRRTPSSHSRVIRNDCYYYPALLTNRTDSSFWDIFKGWTEPCMNVYFINLSIWHVTHANLL